MKAPIDVSNKQMEPFGLKQSSWRELCHETDIEKGCGIRELGVYNDVFKILFYVTIRKQPK